MFVCEKFGGLGVGFPRALGTWEDNAICLELWIVGFIIHLKVSFVGYEIPRELEIACAILVGE